MLPAEFHSVDDFLNFFTQSQEVQGVEGTGGDGAEGGGGGRGLVELQGLLAPLMLRRVKQDVERTLLPKIEINLYLPLSSMQQDLYASLLKKDLGLISGTEGDKSRLLNMVECVLYADVERVLYTEGDKSRWLNMVPLLKSIHIYIHVCVCISKVLFSMVAILKRTLYVALM